MSNDIYWIGGSSCSGKTTCAKKISESTGLVLYNTDTYAFGKYMFGLDMIEKYPAIKKYKDQLCEGLNSFIHRDVFITYCSFIDYCHEVFPFILNDILEIAQTNNVIIEGAHILPELLINTLSTRNSIFLIGTEEQQRTIWLKEMNGEIQGGNENEIIDYKNTKQKSNLKIPGLIYMLK